MHIFLAPDRGVFPYTGDVFASLVAFAEADMIGAPELISFLFVGLLVGVLGGLLGIGLGRVVIHFRDAIQGFLKNVLHFDPFPASFHGFSTIPAHMNPAEHLGIALAAFALCALAALVPAFPAARSDAAKSLRNL